MLLEEKRCSLISFCTHLEQSMIFFKYRESKVNKTQGGKIRAALLPHIKALGRESPELGRGWVLSVVCSPVQFAHARDSCFCLSHATGAAVGV